MESHGYSISTGTLYPILHDLEQVQMIKSCKKVVQGKARKYYHITPKGEETLQEAKDKTSELFNEIFEDEKGIGSDV